MRPKKWKPPSPIAIMPKMRRDLLVTVNPLLFPPSPFDVLRPAAMLQVIDAAIRRQGLSLRSHGRTFLWQSEKAGWNHVYRVPREGGEPVCTALPSIVTRRRIA